MKKTSKTLVTLILILALSLSIFTPALAASQYEYFPKFTGSSCSIVDSLNSLHIDSSFRFRCEIAAVNGISNYEGSPDQNRIMLELLTAGILKDPRSPVTTSTVSATGNKESCALSPYDSGASLIEITREGAPIRTGPGEKYSTIVTCDTGTVLEKISSKINEHRNRWYEVTYRDTQSNICYSGYIYSGNVQKHSHQYETLEYDSVTYKFCDCGRITVLTAVEYTIKAANVVAIAGTAAGTLAVADGPIPLGDMIGVSLLITVGLLDATGVIPDVQSVQEVYEDIDFDELDEDDVCPIDSYRKVTRAEGTLVYLDKDCMSIIEAYIWVHTGNDVWCQDWETALALGSLHPGGCFSEIDNGNKDYWYHYHLGTCTDFGKHVDVVGGHIFYGTSAITKSYPKEMW